MAIMAFKCMTSQAPEYIYLISQFITQTDRELFITGLLSFGTISNLNSLKLYQYVYINFLHVS